MQFNALKTGQESVHGLSVHASYVRGLCWICIAWSCEYPQSDSSTFWGVALRHNPHTQ